MALFITENEVKSLLTMDIALEAVESAARENANEGALNSPRRRLAASGRSLQMMPAAIPAWGVIGYKSYLGGGGGAYFLVFLYSLESGKILAAIEGNKMGQMRTGAASGVATKYMARPEAKRVGIIGSGYQARSQLEAVCAVRPIEIVRVYSRAEEKRRAFADEMGNALSVAIEPAERPQTAVSDADIFIVATNTSEPVLFGEWLPPGTHVNAVGANSIPRRELDDEVALLSGTIVVESLEQAKLEAADLLSPIERGNLSWDRVTELKDVVSGRALGRQDANEITLFKSLGIALWDIAAGYRVYELAKASGIGRELPF